MAIKVIEAAARTVTEQQDKAIGVLQENRQHLDRLADELLEENRLTREEVERILSAP